MGRFRGALLAGLLSLAGCGGLIAADEAPRPPTVAAQSVTLPGAEGTPLRGLLFVPDRPSRPPVIALHSCSGMGLAGRAMQPLAHHLNWAARFVALGHPVLFPDSFGSRGLGEACGRPDFPAPASTLRRQDAIEAARWARAQPWARGEGVVLIGWSHGASTTLAAWNTAPEGLVRAGIALYPGCGPLSGPPIAEVQGRTPLLMLLGEADDWTPARPCQRVAARAPDRIEAITYPGARHSFDQLAGGIRRLHLANGSTVTLGPDPAARAAAQARVAAFLEANAGPP